MNNKLVVRTKAGERKTFRSEFVFISDWTFWNSDSQIVVQSQNAHGPYHWQLFDISSGKEVGIYYLSIPGATPGWVLPLLEQRSITQKGEAPK